jgi:hypothetical protein
MSYVVIEWILQLEFSSAGVISFYNSILDSESPGSTKEISFLSTKNKFT